MKGLKTFLRNMSSALIVQDASWSVVRPQLQRIIPALTHDYHKGQMGRIGVIGGSLDYTGAPFYASKASLLFGGDLVFVFCDKEALLPIKSYSPEFMVTALYDSTVIAQQKLEDEKRKNASATESVDCGEIGSRSVTAMTDKLRESLWRLHVVVVGPGLGR